MQGHAESPISTGASAPHHRVEMSDVADQIAGQVSEAAEAVAEAVLPETPFVARGLRLDWA
ncbi:sugar transferase, partial [Methylobacterium sp. J-077]|nr:sugar transferase [Methylobacterium sp. J-077]